MFSLSSKKHIHIYSEGVKKRGPGDGWGGVGGGKKVESFFQIKDKYRISYLTKKHSLPVFS
jgi:hypothetical protein